MDSHSLSVLGYDDIRRLLGSYASSELARRLARKLEPSSDPARLALSLEQLDEARGLADRGREVPVKGLQDMVALVRRGHRQNRALEPEELLAVRTMLLACGRLQGFFSAEQQACPQLFSLSRLLLDHHPLVEAIEMVVEPPGGVRDRASPRLWELRSRRRELEDRIRTLMIELAQGPRYRTCLQERSYSIRNGRYVLPVKLDRRGLVPGILHDKSASGETVFVEPKDVVVLANELADVQLNEGREVALLLLEVSKKVYADERRLGYTQDVAAWLDFTVARARMSAELGLVPARLVEEPVIRLRGARHPLLLEARRAEGREAEVVPITLTLGADHRLLVITGPNTGGKTVALKTVGLIQLMFQSGLHLPVLPGTELPCLDGVLADIGDEQSLSQSLSTFSGHVRNIVRILAQAGPRSLVLLDELGAGTDPTEGAALGQAILDQLLRVGARTMVTTHLGTLKAFAFTRSEVENASVTFDAETLRPTFELVVGQPGASLALVVAARHGLEPRLVSDARALVDGEKGRADELMKGLMVSRVAAERARQRSEDMVQQSEERLQEAARALEEARGERERIEREAENEVSRVLEEFRRAARPHLNALKNVPKSLVPAVQEVERLVEEGTRMTRFAARRREFLKALKKHDQVYVPRFGQICRVEKLHRAEERLLVKVGGLSMEISFDDVSWVTPPDASPES